jgi:hypothetical protein
MLTIKHIDADGNEGLVECHSFKRERRYDGFIQYMAFGELPLPNDYIATWCGDEEQRVKPDLNRQTLYVMNRHGATVATYYFRQPDFSQVCGDTCQADPESLAA